MIDRLLYYLKLYKAHRIARKFAASYEYLDRDIQFHPDMDVRLDLYTLAGKGFPVLVFVHGGYWSHYHKELFAPAAMKLLPEGIAVVIPDHTLYPHARYEQMTHEIAAALSWTLRNIEQYGGDPKRVFLCGHSSGAHLIALAVMDEQRFLNPYGHTKDEIRGMIYASGGYDFETLYAHEQGKKNGETALMKTMVGITGGTEHFPAASPIHYTQRDLPPTLILHGDADQSVPVAQAIDFHAALQEAGAPSQLKIYPGRGHSEILFSALAEERAQIVADISDFVHGCIP